MFSGIRYCKSLVVSAVQLVLVCRQDSETYTVLSPCCDCDWLWTTRSVTLSDIVWEYHMGILALVHTRLSGNCMSTYMSHHIPPGLVAEDGAVSGTRLTPTGSFPTQEN